MARIRTIKPEFFRHEGLFEAELESGLPLRLAFAGLWTVADREGRFQWRPRALKLDCMPYDACDFAAVMDALEKGDFIQRYEVEGVVYGHIPNWAKHQMVNTREAKSTLPEPCAATHVHARACTERPVHTPNGINIPIPLRETVIARDGGICLRCGASDDLTVDHIFPQSMGGTHAISNLRCLCRKCNSARPVQGQALIDDLAKDGFTLHDMQRTCMHVHAQGEGKGREGKGRSARDASPVEKPEEVSDATWRDWVTLRKAKRAPVTETVVAGAIEESGKAGITIDAFLKIWCQRGSQGLQAEWLKPNERNPIAPQRPSGGQSPASQRPMT